MHRDAEFWINHLGLAPHPEGGYYRETYRASETIPRAGLPDRYLGPRAHQTAIFFLLKGGGGSALHRMQSDEVWFFHAGGSAIIHCIHPDGERRDLQIGPDPGRGDCLQAAIARGIWFGAEVMNPEDYILASCTVAPGFEFEDFELGDSAELIREFPQHADLIRRLCGR